MVTMTREEFIQKIAPLIQKYAPKYGIKVYSPIIAQAVLESGGGTTELAVNANNFFGIKYNVGRCPTANGIYRKVGSEQNKDGSYKVESMLWCQFPSMEACVIGYFDFISHPRYAALKGITDPMKYLQEVKASGYATSLEYVKNVYDKILEYNLTRFDPKEVNMKYSSLVDYIKISPNSTNPRQNKIKKITIHHMAANISVEKCGEGFANPARKASSNYGIDSNGRVGLYVAEENRAWTSSNRDNDNQAITIEVANDRIGGDWHVSDKALAKLIELCTDICKRNDIEELVFTGNKSGNLTMHKWFAATTCPGPYLESKFPYIANEVNKKLGKVPNNTIQADTYVVQPKDTLSKIGAKLGIKWQEIAKLNNIKSPYIIYKDQVLKLPKVDTSFKVKLKTNLNIRTTPGGVIYKKNGARKGVIYTIVAVENNWGLLKSYQKNRNGWICISDTYVTRV